MALEPGIENIVDPAFWTATPQGVQSLVVIVSIMIGFLFIVPRYWATRQAAHATSRAAEISAAAHAWGRFNDSMKHLRSSKMENKVAAVLAIRNFLEQDREGNCLALETLENYVREATADSYFCAKNEKVTNAGAAVPAHEVQAILTLLVDSNAHYRNDKVGRRVRLKNLVPGWRGGWNVDSKPWYLDLSATDLRGADLRGANLSNVCLHNCFLDGANLYGANLAGADLRNAELNGAELASANLSAANLWGASLCGASLIKTDLSNAIMWGADLSHAHLSQANLSGAILGKAILINTQLKGANLKGGNFLGARFVNVDLRETDFRLNDLLTAYIEFVPE